MKLSIFALCFIVINGIIANDSSCEGHNTLTYIENMNKGDISQLLSKLNDLQQGIDECNSRLEKNHKNTDSCIFDIRYDTLPEKCQTQTMPQNCAEATACTQRSGVYRILLPRYDTETFLVECDVKTEGGGWTVIQRRQDGSEDFYRDWSEYQRGFGSIGGEFILGLPKWHALTNYNGPQELLVLLKDKNETRKAFYNNFVIGGECDKYPLKHLGVYSGDAGDSLMTHLGAKFTTKDQNNGEYKDNCAQMYTGAWWYKSCHLSNLNGKYGDKTFGKGVNWQTWRGHEESIEHVTMMIRRTSF